jgi:long-chain acyl-CoA synthetase
MRGIQDQLLHRAQATPDQLYLSQAIDRQWREWTWHQAMDEARAMATALGQLGLAPGDRVAIISRNCAHWILADMAIILAGLVSVPIYPTAKADTITGIVRHSGARAAFIGKLEQPEAQLAGLPEGLITIALPYPGTTGQHAWAALQAGVSSPFELRRREPEDLATLLYTSGSTGQPKGAMHSHANFAWVGQALPEALDAGRANRVLSYLPLSHCTERAYVEASSFYADMHLYFAESIETFMADLAHARPTLFGSVPRLWKKFQLGILAKLPQHKLDRLLGIPIVSGMIKRKIKRGLGLDKAIWYGSGSAPIALSLLQWWDQIGVPIHEGWGMTETFAYGTSLPRGQAPQFGTISKALPGVELKISDDQELLIRCPCLMSGYYQAPELNDEIFIDGFFRTGDRAFIDDGGWVRITGRVKELFKTAKGKYIAPVPIESLLARNQHIELACVLGSGLPQPVALIQLAESLALDRSALVSELKGTLSRLNQELEPHERLSQLIVIAGSWEPENGLLTPTLKLKREQIEQKYAHLVGQQSGEVIFEADSTPA